MKQLTIEHLAHYLPYGLKVQLKSKKATRSGKKLSNYIGALHGVYQSYGDDISVVFREDEEIIDLNCDEIKPILRNLSDLTKEIEHNGEKFVPMVELCKVNSVDYSGLSTERQNEFVTTLENDIKRNRLAYIYMQKLFSLHFDVFRLIEQGLAIDLNKI